MKNYKDSDYALNKHSEGIVYRFADGVVEITLEMYLRENPGKTAEDFVDLKALSDALYLEQDREEYRQTWKNAPLGDVEITEITLSPSPESTFIEEAEESDRIRSQAALARKAWGKLTTVQRRRFYLKNAKGLSTWKIAEAEGVNQSKIMKSLAAAEKKIKKVLSEG